MQEDGRRSKHNVNADSAPKEGNAGRCLWLPKDYRLAYDLRGSEFIESFAEIGQIMEDHFDRERETSSSSSDGESSDDTARRVAVLQTEVIALTAKGRRNTNPKSTKTRNLALLSSDDLLSLKFELDSRSRSK